MLRFLGLPLIFISIFFMQPEIRSLETGKPVERELAGGESHQYRLNASQGQFIHVTIDQRGVDLSSTLAGPDGKTLFELDLTGKGSRESLVWIADQAGAYRLSITTSEKNAPRGAYTITLAALRVPNEQDRARFLAQNEYIAAADLAEAKEKESKQKAVEGFQKAAEIWSGLNESGMAAMTLMLAGDVGNGLRNYDQSIDFYTRALSLYKSSGDRTGESDALRAAGQSYSSSGRKEKAVTYLEQALSIRRALDDREGQGDMLNDLGVIYFELGDKRRARSIYEQALDLRKDQRGRVTTMANLGRVYRDLGESRKAIKIQQDVLSLRRALKDRAGEARALTDLGNAYADTGDVQKALDSLSRALIIQKAPSTYAISGRLYYLIGAHDEALKNLDEAMRLARSAGNRTVELDALNTASLVYWSIPDYKRAIEMLDTALPIARQLKARSFEAALMNNYGRVYSSMGDQRKALEYYSLALPILAEVSNKAGQAAALNNSGFAWESLGDKTKGLDFHRRALKLSEAIHDQRREARAHFGIARIESGNNRLKDARREIEKSINVVESFRSKLLSPDLRADYRASVQQYFDLYIDILMRMGKRQPRSGLIAEALRAGERARARSMVELLTEASADIRQGVDTTLVERESDLQDRVNNRLLEQLQTAGDKDKAAQFAALSKEIEQLTADLREVKTEIRRKSPRYAALMQPQTISVVEMQRSLLDAGSMLLEYWLGEERSYLWVVTKSSLRSYTLPARGKIEPLARRFYEQATARNQSKPNESNQKKQDRITNADNDAAQAAAELSHILLDPIGKGLGSKRLIVIADGALQYIPFAALPEPGSSGKPLIVRHETVNLPSASTLAILRREMSRRPQTSKTVAVLADPVFEADDERVKQVPGKPDTKDKKDAEKQASGNDPSRVLLVKSFKDTSANQSEFRIPRLPNTRREAEAILALTSADARHTDFDFSASRAAAMSDELGRYRIIHIASHGFLNSINPELSGLVLSMVDEKGAPQNGFLLASEIYNLKLPATDLVVLSACQTGLGKEVRGEGLIGLTRGFMYAGSPREVVSMWNVSDRATADLMGVFYHRMLKEGLSPAAALRAAQIELIQMKQWKAPYYWAAFTLQGEWK